MAKSCGAGWETKRPVSGSLWGLGWQLLFIYGLEEEDVFNENIHEYVSDLQHSIASMDAMISTLVTPISFLLTFRLGRAAVRYWDARQALGKLVEVCRSNMATVSVGFVSPIRLRRRQKERRRRELHEYLTQKETEQTRSCENGGGEQQHDVMIGDQDKQMHRDHPVCLRSMPMSPETSSILNQNHAKAQVNGETTLEGVNEPMRPLAKQTDGSSQNDEVELALLCEYARWLAAFPVTVKHFLRPESRPGWKKGAHFRKRRFEIGPLLSDEDAMHVIMEYEDANGNSVPGSANGVRVRISPLVILNRLNELAYDIAYFSYDDDDDDDDKNHSNLFSPSPQAQAAFYQQINEHINILFGAFGAMERIKGTPLPFIYAIHLRTFLLLYLFLWNMSSVAEYGWIALPALFVSNWAFLGIEAAAVECERPFNWDRNHLTLGGSAVMVARNVGQALREVRW